MDAAEKIILPVAGAVISKLDICGGIIEPPPVKKWLFSTTSDAVFQILALAYEVPLSSGPTKSDILAVAIKIHVDPNRLPKRRDMLLSLKRFKKFRANKTRQRINMLKDC